MIVFQALVVQSGNAADTLIATTTNQKLVQAEVVVYLKQEKNGALDRVHSRNSSLWCKKWNPYFKPLHHTASSSDSVFKPGKSMASCFAVSSTESSLERNRPRYSTF